MTLDEIRDELLLEHAGLRRRLETTGEATRRWSRGDGSGEQARAALAALADALRTHNLHEERGLRDVLRTVDAWGRAREGIMDEAHVREHHDTLDELVRLGQARDPVKAFEQFEAFDARMRGHMAWEEKSFLNASVLRDDGVVDGEGG